MVHYTYKILPRQALFRPVSVQLPRFVKVHFRKYLQGGLIYALS